MKNGLERIGNKVAKRRGRSLEVVSRKTPTPKRTSIGKSRKSRPLNKHKKKGWKRYRGQGK
tara:strand:- start:88 stop:270 length:183 start_codon:yes stop_codon:yes gene_type:complete